MRLHGPGNLYIEHLRYELFGPGRFDPAPARPQPEIEDRVALSVDPCRCPEPDVTVEIDQPPERAVVFPALELGEERPVLEEVRPQTLGYVHLDFGVGHFIDLFA